MASKGGPINQHKAIASGQKVTGMKHGGYVKGYAEGGIVGGSLGEEVARRGGVDGLRRAADENQRDAARMRAEGADRPGRSRPVGGQEFRKGGPVKGKRGC